MKKSVILLMVLCSLLWSYKMVDKDSVVRISERTILVDDVPYIIKGICYHPVPVGSDNRDFSNLTEDLALMVEAGINTIRIYEPITEKSVLDEIAEADIKVIVGFGYNQNGVYDILSGSYLDYVNTYKTHKAILFWELGNEYNYHPEWFEGELNLWYATLNDAAALIHKNDTKHPVATAHGELPDARTVSLCPNIDIWGMNVYRWDDPKTIFPKWKALSTKPMYLSEAGADSFMKVAKDQYGQGVNEQAQADATANIVEEIFNASDVCSGVTLFSFTDGWWKAGDNANQNPGGWAPNSSGVPYDGTPNEEYWGIVNIDRSKKKAFDIVKKKYNRK